MCLVTTPCTAAAVLPHDDTQQHHSESTQSSREEEMLPTLVNWIAQPAADDANATTLRTAAAGGGCMDFEAAVGHLQEMVCRTTPLADNQAYTFLTATTATTTPPPQTGNGGGEVGGDTHVNNAGGMLIQAAYVKNVGPNMCVSVLLDQPFIPTVAPNATLDSYWRPTYHPTGYAAGVATAGHVQDPAAPFQDAHGLWHVFPDCWPTTWNSRVKGRCAHTFRFFNDFKTLQPTHIN